MLKGETLKVQEKSPVKLDILISDATESESNATSQKEHEEEPQKLLKIPQTTKHAQW